MKKCFLSEVLDKAKVYAIFDIVFENWKTVSIASLGILSDVFLGRIPFPNEKNTSRLFNYMDEDNDQKIDIDEFGIYLVKLFHAHSIQAFT
jgi:hypothetical protein